ncbi:hypothetical protein Q0M94_11860 [Deinococcus radiomollis]|uniref:hypothetical protein n=1 Tax=Deinococcus radiomollis TaxID=468916 RepID=UPI00389218F7
MRVLQQARLQPFDTKRSLELLSPTNTMVTMQQPLALDALAAHGLSNSTATTIQKIQAIQDFISRNSPHPYRYLHPDGSTANLEILTGTGKGWADVNALPSATGQRIDTDNQFWLGYGRNAKVCLDLQFGTVNLNNGTRASDSINLTKTSAGRYKMTNFATYKFMQCTQQLSMCCLLLASLGIVATNISTTGHDPAMAWVPELGKWVYFCATYNEMYRLDGAGNPLSPLELITYSRQAAALIAGGNAAGGAAIFARLIPFKPAGPTWDTQVWTDPTQPHANYYADYHTSGQVTFVSHLSQIPLLIGPTVSNRSCVLDDSGVLDASSTAFSDQTYYTRAHKAVLYPDLGAAFRKSDVDPVSGNTYISLSNNWPGFAKYQKRINGGAWVDFTVSTETLAAGTGVVDYRPVDANGGFGMWASIEV